MHEEWLDQSSSVYVCVCVHRHWKRTNASIIEKDQTVLNDYLFTCLYLMTFHFDLFQSEVMIIIVVRLWHWSEESRTKEKERCGIDLEHLNTDNFVRFPLMIPYALRAQRFISNRLAPQNRRERKREENASWSLCLFLRLDIDWPLRVQTNIELWTRAIRRERNERGREGKDTRHSRVCCLDIETMVCEKRKNNDETRVSERNGIDH